MVKKVIVLFAAGFEDVEAITPVDYLRRAGAEVLVAGVGGRGIVGSRGMAVNADSSVEELASRGELNPSAWDAVVIPGGMPGAANIAASPACSAFIKRAFDAGILVAAICAAPAVVLSPLGILKGRRYTCFPGREKEVSEALWSEARVVADGNLITSRAAGTAGEWAMEIVRRLYGPEVAESLSSSVLLR